MQPPKPRCELFPQQVTFGDLGFPKSSCNLLTQICGESMNQQIDWLEEIYIGRIILGVLLGSTLPILIVLPFANGPLALNWLFLLTVTYIALVIGSIVAAWPCDSITGRMASGMITALGCAGISLIVSVARDPINGTSPAGIAIMLVGFTLIGLSSGLTVGVLKSGVLHFLQSKRGGVN